MLRLLKIYFCFQVFLVLNTVAFSQRDESKLEDSLLNLIKLQKAPIGAIENPKENLLRDYREEDILNYFLNEKIQFSRFYFQSKGGKETTSLHPDSLLSKHKEYVDDFIKRNVSPQKTPEQKFVIPAFKIINNSIQAMSKIDFYKRNRNHLLQILLAIAKLPDSKEKIELLFSYAHLSVRNDTYYIEMYKICDNAKRYAENIPDGFKRAQAYVLIGDFAYDYRILDYAITTYYLAGEAFDNCNISEKRKRYQQGLINRKLSYVFNQVHLTQASEKEEAYLDAAVRNFNESGNNEDMTITTLSSIAVKAYLWSTYRQYDYRDEIKENNRQNLLNLSHWYFAYKRREGMDVQTTYFGFYSIGEYLREKDMKVASLYFLYALPYAALTSSTSELFAILENIEYAYLQLGKDQLALDYGDLQLYLANQLNDKFEVCSSMLDKAFIFYKTRRYDSATKLINQVMFDTSLSNYFYPDYYNQLMETAAGLKYKIFDSLGITDSARKYEMYFVSYQTDHHRQLISLLEVESKSITDLLDRSTTKEIGGKEKLLKIRQDDIDFLHRENGLLDSISKLNVKHARDSLVQAVSLVKLKDSLRLADSVNNANQKANISKEGARKRGNIITLAIFSFLLLTTLFLINMVRIQKKRRKAENVSKREEIRRTKAEMKLLSTLAINHDLDKFIPQLHIFLKEASYGNKELLQEVVEGFKDYYGTTKQLGDSLVNTIKNEIAIARKSSLVYLYMVRSKATHNINTNFDGNSEIESLELPKNMITSFIANSIKHGTIGKESISIMVDVQKKANEYCFTIEDDGVGFHSLSLEDRPSDKGINLIINQVQNFNENYSNYKIQFSPEDVRNKLSNNGVIVTFKLIKV
ncbi:MAG TPA: hypothetical protein DCQ50_21060 [Chryseobacterium sp.]|nr:hypothetical protein [Chryseobacterium sp.]